MTPTSDTPAFLASDLPPAAPDKARFHVIPAPLEATVSYGAGAALGPRAILEASQQLEAFDGIDTPGAWGIHTQPLLPCDTGDTACILEQLQARVGAALRHNALPVILGGEHTVTLGAVRALKAAGKPFGVVQFDAHADLREQYDGTHHSHACVMRRIAELEVPFFQIGVRALSEPEARFRRERRVPHMDAADLMMGWTPFVTLPSNFPEAIYITFDVDAFDPSVMPGTGTPEPGGLNWYQALSILRGLVASRRVVGFDVVELAPIPGSHVSEFTAAKLVYAIMGLIGRLSKG